VHVRALVPPRHPVVDVDLDRPARLERDPVAARLEHLEAEPDLAAGQAARDARPHTAGQPDDGVVVERRTQRSVSG